MIGTRYRRFRSPKVSVGRRSGATTVSATVLLAVMAVLATSVLVATSPVPPSNAGQLVPGVPNAPVITSVAGGDQQLTVSFIAPATAVAVVTYQYSTDGGATWRLRSDGGSTASPVVVTLDSFAGAPLVNGTTYNVGLRATNAVGVGFMSNVVAGTPVGSAAVPGAPTAVVAWPTFAGAVVNWLPPQSDGGSPITGYEAIASPGGATCTVPAPGTWCTISDLSNSSTVTVAVRAINAVGPGPLSQPSAPVTPAPLPGQPADVTAVAGDARATVSWTPSDENRGSPVRRFTVTASPGGTQCTVAAPSTTCVVVGLTNQVAYQFSVVATNNTGDGPPSEPSAPVVPTAAGATMALRLFPDGYGNDGSSVPDGSDGSDSPDGPDLADDVAEVPGSPGTEDDSWSWLWDPTPAIAIFSPVVVPGAAEDDPSGGSHQGDGAGQGPGLSPGINAPGGGGGSSGTVAVNVEITAAQGMGSWCRSSRGIAGYTIVMAIDHTGVVAAGPDSGDVAKSAGIDLGPLGDATVVRFAVWVPANLHVGRHRVWGSCVDPSGREVGPGLTGVLDVVAM